MNVTFYSFTKRVNSTKQPGGGALSASVNLKAGSSTLSPHISLLWQGGGSPAAYNYAYIPSYLRYYFVKNWTYEERQWVAELTVDPLASWRSYIGSASKYVVRASARHSTDTIDTMWPTKSTFLTQGALAGDSLGWANYGSGGGIYVITVIGKNNISGGGSVASQYQLSGPTLQTMINNMMDGVQGAYNAALGTTTIREAVQNMLMLPWRFSTDLSQYIKNLMWFPCLFPSAGASPINLGMYNVLGSVATVSAPLVMFSGSCALPSVGAGRERWEYLAPYGSYWFKMLPFGVIPIDPVDAVDGSTITYTVGVDSMSGLGTLTLSIDGRVIATRCAQIGIAVPYGGSAPNYAGAITAAAGIAEAAQSERGLSAAAVGSAIGSMSTHGFASGSAGGGGALEGVGHVYYRVLDHVDIDNDDSGRPLCETVTLSSIPGYIMCKDGEVAAPCTDRELSMIESYLKGGFYYE